MAQKADADQTTSSFCLASITELLKCYGDQNAYAPLLRQSADHYFYNALLTHCISVDHEGPHGLVCTLRVPPSLCNANGKLHGGAITSLVDVIGSAPLYTAGMSHSGVSVDMNVTFLAEASMGEEIEIEAKTLSIDEKSMAVIAVDIRLKATGTLVAQGRHSKFLQMPATSTDGRSRL